MTVITKCLGALILVTSLSGIASAQQVFDYPSKPVRIVVPYPAGGSGDIVARAIAQKMAEAWGQPVLAF